MDDLKRRLEKLLGEPPAAAEKRAMKQQVERQHDAIAQQQQRIAAAGAGVVSAVCQLLGELVPAAQENKPDPAVVSQVRTGLDTFVGNDDQGRPQLRLTLPDSGALDQLATALASLVGISGKERIR
jgi:hypothetical protein